MATDPYDLDEQPPALGLVLDEGRGSLPYSLIHGEALVACAAWALGEAGVTSIDVGMSWEDVRLVGGPFVLHDALCPMTPPDFIAACVRRAVDDDVVVVGVRPVTDTVKVVTDGMVGETVDRDGLVSISSPVVLPGSVVATLDQPPTLDVVRLLAGLRDRFPVSFLEAPASSARVASVEEVRALERLTMPAQP